MNLFAKIVLYLLAAFGLAVVLYILGLEWVVNISTL